MHSKNTLRNIIWTVIALMLVVSFIFVYGEKYDSHKTINDEKVGNYFTAIGAIVTAATLVFIAMQFRQSERIHQQNSAPLILPYTQTFYTKDVNQELIFSGDVILTPFFFTDERMENPFHPQVEIHNKGLGIATNIRCVWKYDSDKLKEYISGTYREFPDTLNYSVSFIPINEAKVVPVPRGYLISCGVKLNRNYYGDVNDNDRAPQVPLSLRVLYEDRLNNTYEKRYHVTVSAIDNQISFEYIELK